MSLVVLPQTLGEGNEAGSQRMAKARIHVQVSKGM